MGKDVLTNGNPMRVMITNANLEQNYDDRKITSLSPLNRGDIVLFEGKKYLIISEVNTKRYNKSKAIMRHLPHHIVINSECRFISLDCYINTGNLGVLDGRVLSIPDGEITVVSTLINNDSDLKIGARFLIYGQAFKVTGIDRYSKPGLLILTCKKDLIDDETDNLINGIAGGNGCPINVISNNIALTVGTTYQLTWTSTNNAPVAFKSADDTIVTVTVSAGQSRYTISLTSMGDLDQINKGYGRTYNAVVTGKR